MGSRFLEGRSRERERSYPNLVGHANDVASLFSPFCSWMQGGLTGFDPVNERCAMVGSVLKRLL